MKMEKKSLIFFSFPIKVFENTGNCGALYDIIYIVENCSPVAGVDLPLAMYTERYLPYTVETEMRSPEAALTLAYRELAEQIREDGELSSGKKDRRGVGETILLILGAPLWIALLLAGFSVLIAIYAVLWSLILALWALEHPFLLFSIVSKYLLPGCTATTHGALALTKKSVACVLRLFKRGPVL